MKKVKLGVVGSGRGRTMMKYCGLVDNVELVAICEKRPEGIETIKEVLKDMKGADQITYYSDFDEFLEHEMDAVVLANYATEHAPFAIKCMEKGLHVLSEVLPVQTMAEAVALVEAVERTGKIYAYAENYCYMAAPYEMRRLYREGAIGEFTYGEGEYIHNNESIWAANTYNNKNHWRYRMYANFYCTHSIGPIIHITGLRPVKVTGYELPINARQLRIGAMAGAGAVEMIELENGGLIKSAHGPMYRHSVWYSVYGQKGRLECEREKYDGTMTSMVYADFDDVDGRYDLYNHQEYRVQPIDRRSEETGHGGSDFYVMYNFIAKILGDKDADTIDVYEALDMFLPGMFAYRSVLNGGIPMDIPNLRNKEEREKWRNDTTCTDPDVAGDMLIPTYSKEIPTI